VPHRQQNFALTVNKLPISVSVSLNRPISTFLSLSFFSPACAVVAVPSFSLGSALSPLCSLYPEYFPFPLVFIGAILDLIPRLPRQRRCIIEGTRRGGRPPTRFTGRGCPAACDLRRYNRQLFLRKPTHKQDNGNGNCKRWKSLPATQSPVERSPM
jgi:hypothetical protein